MLLAKGDMKVVMFKITIIQTC